MELMEKLIFSIMVCVLMGLPNIQAASTDTDKSGFQLTVELRDGSRVVGQSAEDTLSVHSAAMGNLKLAWVTIRSIEYAANSDTARLTATNGDGFAVQLDADTLRLTTDFGKTELPVKMIRSIKVALGTKRTITATTTASANDFRLTIELRDGSHLVGKGLDDALKFHSPTMGDLKLTWAGIRSVTFTSEKSATARLTTTNGDAYEVEFVTAAVRVETSFGKNELPVKSIRSIKVSALSGRRQLPDGLVALWSGEGNANDSVGGNNGRSTAGISYADGVSGQAFKFDGTRMDGVGYIPIPASPSLDIGANGGFTIACWVKPDHLGPPGAAAIPIIEWDSSNNCGLQLWVDQGFKLLVNIVDTMGNGHALRSADSSISRSHFQHIALTYDKSTGMAFLYVNGEQVASENFGNITPQTTYPVNIGRRTGQPIGLNNTYSGLLDELALYNRALSAEEIQAVCKEENHGELPPPVQVRTTFNGIYRSGSGVNSGFTE